MGAKASDRVLVTCHLMYLVDRLRNIQEYRIVKEIPDDKNGVIFEMSHDMSFSSWGENITVEMYPFNETQTVVEVLSKCSLPTQVFDLGQNKNNVTDILSYLLLGLQVQKGY